MPPHSLCWHEHSSEEQQKIFNDGISTGTFMLIYEQPSWCEYPEALRPTLGCSSLVWGYVHSRIDCKGCVCNKED